MRQIEYLTIMELRDADDLNLAFFFRNDWLKNT